MRVLLKQQCFFLVFGIILATFLQSASAVPAKDHKKKLLEKLRNALNQTELEEADSVTIEVSVENGTVEELPEAKTPTSSQEEKEVPEKSEEELEVGGVDAEDKKSESDSDKGESSSTDIQKGEGPTSYLRKNLVKMRTILKRIFDLFGFRQSKKKEGRQDRMLSGDDSYSINGLEYDFFKEDIKTTVGAVLGEKECIQKIVCGAGSYLRSVNGKHVILTILDHVTPSAWTDTVDLLKKSAVTDGDCTYKCLEEDDAEN